MTIFAFLFTGIPPTWNVTWYKIEAENQIPFKGDEAFFADDDEEEVEEPPQPSSISGEDIKTNKFLTQEEKTPKFIIIGATKCSTSALLR